MNGHEKSDKISAYLDNELSGPESAELKIHLASCAICREELESLRQTKSVLARAPRRVAPPQLIADIEERRRKSGLPAARITLPMKLREPGK